jgi:outer membrane protein TolC
MRSGKVKQAGVILAGACLIGLGGCTSEDMAMFADAMAAASDEMAVTLTSTPSFGCDYNIDGYLVCDDTGDGFGMVFGTVSIPISGWWEAKYKMKERRIKEEQNQNMVNDTNEKLLLQMQQGLNMLNEAYKQVQLTKTSIGQAEENLRVTQNNYEAGMVNVSDMLEAQAQLQQSRDKYTDALTQYKIAKVNYLQVTGR